MAMLLYVAGALALLAGLVAIGFGTPASALDFGNTLIAAGTTAAVGGLITIALAAVLGRLQRVAELLSAPLPHDNAHAVPPPRPAPPAPPPPPPLPRVEPKRAQEPAPFEPRGPSIPPEFPPFPTMTPKAPEPPLPKPQAEEPVAASEPEPDLHQAEPPATAPEPALPAGPSATERPLPEFSIPDFPSAERSPPELPAPELPPKSFFDSVWPEEQAAEPPPEPAAPPPAPKADEPERPRAVAVLKSGVVDGMGYTLYVDGSIEADLPQGVVRFASINELREHLQNSGS